MTIETLENISLACCSMMCVGGFGFFFVINAIAGRLGSSAWGILSGIGLSGLIGGLMSGEGIMDMVEELLGIQQERGDGGGR